MTAVDMYMCMHGKSCIYLTAVPVKLDAATFQTAILRIHIGQGAHTTSLTAWETGLTAPQPVVKVEEIWTLLHTYPPSIFCQDVVTTAIVAVGGSLGMRNQ